MKDVRPVWFTIVLLVGAAGAQPTAGDVALARRLEATQRRGGSPVMVRYLTSTTRASLDWAAWHHNPILDAAPAMATGPAAPVEPARATFGGAVQSTRIQTNFEDLPLQSAERAAPLAIEPLVAYLANWDYDAGEPFLTAIAQIEMESWGGAESATPRQRAVAGWLTAGDPATLWVEIEFAAGVKAIAGVRDADADGYDEIYAPLVAAAVPPPVVARIRDDYLGRPLDRAELWRYYNELVAEWYPRFRTVLLSPEESRPWPNGETEPGVAAAVGGRFEQPTVVVRAVPAEQPLYNVFVLDGIALEAATPAFWPLPVGGGLVFAADGTAMEANLARWRSELQNWGGGSWSAWAAKVKSFRDDVTRQLAARDAQLKGLVGRDGFLFFRGSLQYVTAGELRGQPNGRDPYPAIVDFGRQLKAKGIDMLVVIIPSKPEVHPDKISSVAPAGGRPYVQPYVRKLLLELGQAGIEAVDLHPTFVAEAARAPDSYYLPLDTHWSNAAVVDAAELIGRRVRQYPWYAGLGGQPARYRTRAVSFTRTGDIVAMLSPSERSRYRPMRVTAQQVIGPDGQVYQDSPSSPIVMLGDSFCGIYQNEGCNGAGLSAHVAKQIGLPVDLIMAHGSGPRIRAQFVRRGATAIRQKKLVIWTVVARDLYNYWAPWDRVQVP